MENYIVHGFNRSRSDNRISIKGKLEQGDIVLQVVDNGTGISSDKLELINQQRTTAEVNPTGSIGLANVQERIQIVFGKVYGITIESAEDSGTQVILRIPARTREEIQQLMSR